MAVLVEFKIQSSLTLLSAHFLLRVQASYNGQTLGLNFSLSMDGPMKVKNTSQVNATLTP